MEDRNLSLSSVAGSLSVSERTVRRWIKSGKLKAYKPGRDYRISESALRAFVQESEVSPKGGRRSSSEPSFNDVLGEERRKKEVDAAFALDELSELGERVESELKLLTNAVPMRLQFRLYYNASGWANMHYAELAANRHVSEQLRHAKQRFDTIDARIFALVHQHIRAPFPGFAARRAEALRADDANEAGTTDEADSSEAG